MDDWVERHHSMNAQPASFDDQLAKSFRASHYMSRMCMAHPSLVDELRAACGAPLNAGWMREQLDLPGSDGLDEATLHRRLRQLRRFVMCHSILRDINGFADFGEVVATISTLAEVVVAAALQFHARELARQFSIAETDADRAHLLVVGMGKLGGNELNVSSDIDLIFVYDEDGEANSQRSWHEFHAELGKRLIRALDEVDADGFVFRVDMRLRPFGASGPLVTSLAALEQYFITQARPWERYAWLKARALTGAVALVSSLSQLVTSFVYRRYHDYAAIEEMRDLHGQIRAQATRRNRLDDVKVGVGGIREIEFIAQLFQLIRGGRETSLQTRSTQRALTQLAHLGIFSDARVAALQNAYVFLRNLEHRLQYLDDQQTQQLPSGDDNRQRIAEAMNAPGWATFLAVLDQHRQFVTSEFEALFSSPTKGSSTTNGLEVESDNHSDGDLAAQVRAIAKPVGHAFADDVGARTAAWHASPRTQTLSAKSRARMEALIPFALKASLQEDSSVQTFFRLFALIEAIDKRETYLALLIEYPQVLARVARIAAKSAWATELLRRHPILLDELISPPPREAGLDWPQERATLQRNCDAAHGDVERQYEILRHAKQAATLKLNIAEIEGRLGVMAISDELSALADLLVDVTLVLVWRSLNPAIQAGDWCAPLGFAVIGFGKLGSKELGYASDLDLVFIYDAASGIETERYARFAQRIVSWLNTMTAGGVLYETDLRLRPDGASGLMVSSLDAFREYQLQRAWTWEHQALTRARFFAGDSNLAAPFELIRREVLTLDRDKKKLRDDILAMREKMRAEKKDRPDAIDLKHTRGGMVDVEFIVQYLILAYSREYPAFLGNLGNFALLSRAAALGILDEELAAAVGKAYLAFRERQHRARTNNEAKTWVKPDELGDLRAAVVQAWDALFGKVSA